MVQLEKLLSWAQGQGAWLSPSLKVTQSPLGGLGLLATGHLEEDSIVLRVPQNSTYDIKNLLHYAEQLKKGRPDVSNVFSSVLLMILGPTETTVIRGYVWSFAILQSMGVDLEPIAPYLDVLRTTEVLDVDENLEVLDSLVQWQIMQKRRVTLELCEMVKAHPEFAPHLLAETAFRLHQAVKSRVLEIPHPVEDEEYEFTTRVTLVPLLDFANHAQTNNAVFDVDRTTGDVILRVTKPVDAETEVCISYSPSNDMGLFFRTYGFIPQHGVYEWVLPLFNCITNAAKGTSGVDYVKMAKWLRVKPRLVFALSEDAVTVDLTESRLPLLMVPGLTYYAGWRDEKADIEEDEHDIEELIFEEENNPVILSTETAYGVVFEDAYVSVPDILEQTWEDSEHGIRELVKLTKPLIDMAAKTSKEADVTTLAASASQHASTQLKGYFAAKHALLDRLLELSTQDFVYMIGTLP